MCMSTSLLSGTVPTMLFFCLGVMGLYLHSAFLSSSVSTWSRWMRCLSRNQAPAAQTSAKRGLRYCQGVLQRKIVCLPVRPVCRKSNGGFGGRNQWALWTCWTLNVQRRWCFGGDGKTSSCPEKKVVFVHKAKTQPSKTTTRENTNTTSNTKTKTPPKTKKQNPHGCGGVVLKLKIGMKQLILVNWMVFFHSRFYC